jgi:aspartate--ammonia ligase
MATTPVEMRLGPVGPGDCDEIEAGFPRGYRPLLNPIDTQRAIFALKGHIEEHLCRELGLLMVTAPAVVEVGKWKRRALARLGLMPGEGLCVSMDQWDWELAIREDQRTLALLTEVAGKVWKVLKQAETFIRWDFPQLSEASYPGLPERLTFVHAEDLLARYPRLPRKARETAILREAGAVFIYGIGWPLADGHPHAGRAADMDDWSTPTASAEGRPRHGLNGNLLVWNPVTRRRHELATMGIRVTAERLRAQLAAAGQLDRLRLPYHQAVLRDELPLSIGGSIGQSRTAMLLLRKAHVGEVTVGGWPKVLD